MTLRWYQTEAIDSTISAWKRGVKAPLICLPTASGKSRVIAEIAHRFRTWYPNSNAIVAVHTKELVGQLAATYQEMTGEIAGVYSASLRSRTTGRITIAQIQSIYSKTFNNVNLVIVDECDRVPPDGGGMYRTFFEGLAKTNPNYRRVGLTATPYRLGSGLVYGSDQPWEEMVYDADIRTLINQGYLANLISVPCTKVNLSGVRRTNGEYNSDDLDSVLMDDSVLDRAVKEVVAYRRGRVACLHFSHSVPHAYKLSDRLCKFGIRAPVVHGNMVASERDQLIQQFKSGILNDIVNVNILTVGFDAPRIDTIAFYRATLSPGLYYQILGRGFRTSPATNKTDCMVIDLGGNIDFHGPVDTLNKRIKAKSKKETDIGEAPTKECPKCHDLCHAAASVCENCGYKFPEKESNHSDIASTASPLSGLEVYDVIDVHYQLNPGKGDKPNTVKVSYKVRGTRKDVCIWLSCDAAALGFAKTKWLQWLMAQQFVDGQRKLGPGPICYFNGEQVALPKDAREWLPWLRSCVAKPKRITVVEDGGAYPNIMRYEN